MCCQVYYYYVCVTPSVSSVSGCVHYKVVTGWGRSIYYMLRSSAFNQDRHKRGVFTQHTLHEFFMTSVKLPILPLVGIRTKAWRLTTNFYSCISYFHHRKNKIIMWKREASDWWKWTNLLSFQKKGKAIMVIKMILWDLRACYHVTQIRTDTHKGYKVLINAIGVYTIFYVTTHTRTRNTELSFLLMLPSLCCSWAK